MPPRQHDRYSIATQTADLRHVVFELIVVTIILALVLNLISNAVSTTVDELRLPLVWRLILVAALLLIGVLAAFWFWRKNDILNTQVAQIDLLIPYEINKTAGLFVPAPDPAPYSVIEDACEIFAQAYSIKQRQALARDFKAWLGLDSSRQFKDWAYPIHHQLVDALLLNALHFNNERALGALSRVAWERSNLQSEKRTLNWFPQRLQQNPFLISRQGKKYLMPEAVTIAIKESSENWTWEIRHDSYGSLFLSIDKAMTVYPWDIGTKKILTLREGLPDPAPESQYLALGSRIRAWAEIRGILARDRQNADTYCTYATQLLTILEQALDWNYFDTERRPPQQRVLIYQNVTALRDQVALLNDQLQELKSQLDFLAPAQPPAGPSPLPHQQDR